MQSALFLIFLDTSLLQKKKRKKDCSYERAELGSTVELGGKMLIWSPLLTSASYVFSVATSRHLHSLSPVSVSFLHNETYL